MSLKQEDLRTVWKYLSELDEDVEDDYKYKHNSSDCYCVVCNKPFAFWQRKYKCIIEEENSTVLTKGHLKCFENEVKLGRMVMVEY